MKGSSISAKSFIEQQNKFRGLVSEYRSRRFVKDPKTRPSCRFRSGLRELLLDARVAIHPSQFDVFLNWVDHQMEVQIADIAEMAIGYDDLRGVYTDAPTASLEYELLWITARIKADSARFNDFRSGAEEVERLVFIGKLEAAIEALKLMELAFGVSLWSVQLRIALEHQAGGLEQQKRYTAEVRGVYKRGLLGFIAYHTSVRNEDRTTLTKFCDDIKVRIDRHQHYEPFVKNYARYRLAGEWPASESGLADILRVEQSHSSIDIYETFVAVAQEIARSEGFHKCRKVLGKCLRNLTAITDFRLAKIALVLDGNDAPMVLSPRSTEISDALFLGDARLAAQISRRTVKEPHGIDIWQFIYSGLAFAHATRSREREFRRPNDISRLIGRVLCRCNVSDDSFGLLGKLGINLRGLPAAAGLIDLLPLLHRTRPDDPWQPWLISMNSPVIGVEDLVPNTAPTNLTIQTTGSRNLGPTEAAWLSFHGLSYAPTNVSQAALTLCKAVGLLRKKQCQQVVDMIGTQLTISGSEPLRSMAASILLNAYFCIGDRQNVITLIADEGARSEANRRLLPVLPTLEHYTWSDYKTVSEPLKAPIALHLLWRINEDREIASRLRYATGAFFRNHAVTRPSKLIDFANVYQHHQLVYFLKEVCVPHILDGSRILKSSREVMEERQAVCAALREFDHDNADDYQNEVISISNQLALDEGQWIVDRTRVYVDTEALSRWAMKELSEDYARYRDLLGVNVGTTQKFDDVLKEIAMATSSQRSTFTPENEADAVLFGMLHRLREEFLYNPSLGFDFYLSNRVRHHSFIGLIRRPLESAQLITTRETESGGYHRNEFWLEKFAGSNSEAKEILNEAFAKFAANFDDTLTVAKESFYVHSLERPGGLLYLELTPQLVTIVRAIDQMDTTLPDFINTAIAVLWAAIEPSLAKVRYFISEHLKTKITDGFNELRATVRKCAEHGPSLLEFDIEIGNCSTEVQYKLDDAAKWFSYADLEAHKQPFKLDQIVNISIDSALKCQRTFDPVIERHVDGDIEMQASNLVFVHDVLFVALDNVRAHSECKKPKVSINVQANIENGTLTIKVQSDTKLQNRAKHDEELRRIRQLIEIGNFGPYTRREGGSGLLKLAAVVLRQSAKGQIDFGFTEDGQFQLTVTYSMIVLTPD